LEFEQKCRTADAIYEIHVEKVETTDLTEGMTWQFKALARCKIVSVMKGSEKAVETFVFIPCGYEFDESPCDIEQGKSYVVFLETMGNFSSFGHPLSAFCCHPVVDGKANPDYFGKDLIGLDAFAEKVRASLKTAAPAATKE
jgi:hypothetical protein